jgi:putative hemolysin
MQSLVPGVLVILGLIVARGILSMAECALGSCRHPALKDRSGRGDRGAEAALRLGADPKGYVPALQAGITLLGAMAGVYAGAILGPALSRAIGESGPFAGYRDAAGIGVVALGITLATLVLGDLVPRRVAQHRPEPIAGLVSRPVQLLAMMANPVIGAIGAATDLALKVVGIRPTPEPPVTEEAIRVLMKEGTKAGVFEEVEHEMVKRVLRFGDRRARSLMTPRNEIIWIDLADSPEEVRRKVIDSPHSRFPVCDQSLDNLIGIVHVKDLLGQAPNAEPFRIKGRLTLPLFLYEGTTGLKILEMFKTSAMHSAIVLDEYGTVEGLLTLTDMLEAIVGELPEGVEDEEPAAVRRPDGSWLLDGRLPLDDFRDLFDLPAIPEGDFHTLAGFVVARLGHIPRIAEGFEDVGLYFEVVDMDGNRVDRILVQPARRQDGDPPHSGTGRQ